MSCSTSEQAQEPAPHAVFIDAFHGGSHKQLTDLLVARCSALGVRCTVLSLPPKKWHWRLFASALHFSTLVPRVKVHVLFVTSMLRLADLLALRPDLQSARKVLYMHENQLAYPSRKDNDFNLAYAQILSCLCADTVLWNSEYNRDSFITAIDTFMRKIPESQMRVLGLGPCIANKSVIAYVPITLETPLRSSQGVHTHDDCICNFVLSRTLHSDMQAALAECTCPEAKRPKISDSSGSETNPKLRILWNHRWEHDKNPEAFFEALHELVQENVPFEAVVIGQSFAEEPEVFEKARPELERYGALVHWGYVEREQYDVLVASCDVVVSCALHEFFGISMLEAAVRGCYPLCPNRLAYPEIFPEEHLYNTPRQLFKRLRSFCRAPKSVRTWRSSADGGAKLDLERFRWEGALAQVYIDALALNTVTYTTPT